MIGTDAAATGGLYGMFIYAIIPSERVYELNKLGKDERLKKLQEISNSFS